MKNLTTRRNFRRDFSHVSVISMKTYICVYVTCACIHILSSSKNHDGEQQVETNAGTSLYQRRQGDLNDNDNGNSMNNDNYTFLTSAVLEQSRATTEPVQGKMGISQNVGNANIAGRHCNDNDYATDVMKTNQYDDSNDNNNNNNNNDSNDCKEIISSTLLSPSAPITPRNTSRSNVSTRSKNFYNKLRLQEKKFQHKQNKQRIETYSDNKWFISTLSKLYDYRKRSSSSKEIPAGIDVYIYIYIHTYTYIYMIMIYDIIFIHVFMRRLLHVFGGSPAFVRHKYHVFCIHQAYSYYCRWVYYFFLQYHGDLDDIDVSFRRSKRSRI